MPLSVMRIFDNPRLALLAWHREWKCSRRFVGILARTIPTTILRVGLRLRAGRNLLVTALLCALSGLSFAQQPTKILNSVVNPNGWVLPQHHSVAGKKLPYGIDLTQYRVDAIAFEPDGVFKLPCFFMSDNDLIVSSTNVLAKSIYRLDYAGKTFGYYALVFDTETAAAYPVWWIDSGGTGKFTHLIRSNTFPGVPDWVGSLRGTDH